MEADDIMDDSEEEIMEYEDDDEENDDNQGNDNIDGEEDEEVDEDEADTVVIAEDALLKRANTSLQIRQVPNDERITSDFLTKSELSRIISVRAEMLSRNPVSFVSCEFISNPIDIVIKEIREKKSPLNVVRILPNGEQEVWSVNEMNVKEEFLTLQGTQ